MHWLIGFLFFFAAGIYLSSRRPVKEQLKRKAGDSLAALLRCTQTGQPLVTDWTISVSDEMRRQLYWPLSHDIVHTIATTAEPPQESRFVYRCTECQVGDKVITGTVDVIIDYVNAANGLDLHWHFVPVRMKLEVIGPMKGWALTEVQHD